jgi:hypothetical protein
MQGLLLAVLAMIAVTPQLSAQRLDDLRPGTRLRLMIRDAREPVVGLLEDTPAVDTIRLRDSSGALMEIVRSEIGRAEVSRGRHGQGGKGALLGLLVGLAAAIPLATSCDCDQAAAGLVYGVTMGTVGAGVGALFGTLGRSEVWQGVMLEGEGDRAVTLTGEASAR